MPFVTTGTMGQFNVNCSVQGGGPSGQAQASGRTLLSRAEPRQTIAPAPQHLRRASLKSVQPIRSETAGGAPRDLEGAPVVRSGAQASAPRCWLADSGLESGRAEEAGQKEGPQELPVGQALAEGREQQRDEKSDGNQQAQTAAAAAISSSSFHS